MICNGLNDFTKVMHKDRKSCIRSWFHIGYLEVILCACVIT